MSSPMSFLRRQPLVVLHVLVRSTKTQLKSPGGDESGESNIDLVNQIRSALLKKH